MTVEQEPKGEESIEKVFADIQEAIQPVIDGDVESQPLLSVRDEEYQVYFPTVRRVSSKLGRQVLKWLQVELESETDRASLGKAEIIDEDHYTKPPWLVPTKHTPVRLVRTEVFNRRSGEREAVVWSIRNLEPKSRK